MVRVLIADDQSLILESLEMMLNLKEGIEVVGTARNGQEAIELAGWGHVELVFFDASDEALLRRFNETRRPHPLLEPRSGQSHERKVLSE